MANTWQLAPSRTLDFALFFTSHDLLWRFNLMFGDETDGW